VEHSSFYRIVTRVLVTVAALTVLVLMVQVVADVTMRFVFRSPVRDTIERVSFWWMPAIAYLGMAIAQEEKEHIDVPLVYMRTGVTSQVLMDVFRNVVTMGFLAVVTYFGTQSALSQMARGEYRARVVVWPARFVVPIAGALFILYLLQQTAVVVREARHRVVQQDQTASH
jgi:TRAP-type C4-dicarboxylate transport system permease small subunit